ncbi:hypothetical protein BJ165DRAFT_1397535 [Panaeolus papilionaceus]|nr:hypothetical protein BJ165DRAFT_1397535 [Panaeolus papilionaceus]
MEIPELENLKITGEVSVEVTSRIPRQAYLYMFMGPTGAGKSSFIEGFAGGYQTLSIAKDQLGGCTQNVTAYRLVFRKATNRPVYLVDTPGFSDPKISEIEIMDMVKQWLKDNGILFLTPITGKRLAGSRRKTIEMFKQLFGPYDDLDSVIFVTTMWDNLYNEQTQTRADSNFSQLADEVFKELFGGHEISITRFMNTRSSALEVVDQGNYYTNAFIKHKTSTSPHLYHDLHERIVGALQQKKIIELDLAQPDAQVNLELKAILEENQRENNETLTKFIKQFVDFGRPPSGFGRAAQQLRKSIAVNTHPANTKYRLLYWQWAHEVEIPAGCELGESSSRNLAIKGLLSYFFDASKHPKAKSLKHGE